MTDQTAKFVLLDDGAEYALSAEDGGEGFVLQNKAEGLNAELRGEDAIRFRQDYDALKSQYPAWTADQRLANFAVTKKGSLS